MYDIILKQGKERSFQRRHPWVFSGALSKIPQGVSNGETVRVLSSQGEFLGYGAYSATSSIAIRIWSFDINDLPGYDFFERKFRAALTFRKNWNTSASSTENCSVEKPLSCALEQANSNAAPEESTFNT